MDGRRACRCGGTRPGLEGISGGSYVPIRSRMEKQGSGMGGGKVGVSPGHPQAPGLCRGRRVEEVGPSPAGHRAGSSHGRAEWAGQGRLVTAGSPWPGSGGGAATEHKGRGSGLHRRVRRVRVASSAQALLGLRTDSGGPAWGSCAYWGPPETRKVHVFLGDASSSTTPATDAARAGLAAGPLTPAHVLLGAPVCLSACIRCLYCLFAQWQLSATLGQEGRKQVRAYCLFAQWQLSATLGQEGRKQVRA